MSKTTAHERSILVEMAAGRSVYADAGTWVDLACAGLVARPCDEYELTDAGRAVAAAEQTKQTAARAKRNAAARGRASALASVGMKRTRSGAWE